MSSAHTEGTTRTLSLLAPALASLTPALGLLSANAGQVEFRELLVPSLFGLALAGGFHLLGLALTRSWIRAGLFSFTAVVLFFLTGRVAAEYARQSADVAGFEVRIDQLVVAVGILLASASLLARPPKDGRRTLQLLTVFPAVFGGLSLVALATAPKHEDGLAQEVERLGLTSEHPRPHVFHLLLDGYGREDVLRERYGFDDPLAEGLRERGFRIASRARTTYAQTALVLASLLDLDYLAFPDTALHSGDRRPLHRRIQNGRALQLLRSAGYETVAFAHGYDLAELRTADRFLAGRRSLYERSEFLRSYLELTPLEPLGWSNRIFGNRYASHRGHIRFALETVGSLAAEKKPLYVLAHVIAPHEPFLFDEHGETELPRRRFSLATGRDFLENTGLSQEAYREGYVGQARWVAARTLAAIDGIRANASREVAIFIHSDHGPAMGLDWSSMERTDLEERMSALNALWLPDEAHESLPEDASPLNAFRHLFANTFGMDLEPLPERIHFSGWERPYRFTTLEDGPDGKLRAIR